MSREFGEVLKLVLSGATQEEIGKEAWDKYGHQLPKTVADSVVICKRNVSASVTSLNKYNSGDSYTDMDLARNDAAARAQLNSSKLGLKADWEKDVHISKADSLAKSDEIEYGRNVNAASTEGFFTRMWNQLWGMIESAAVSVTNFFKQKNESGDPVDGTVDYYRVAGVAMFFALMCFGVYKLIKWIRVRKEEKTVEAFNTSFKEYKNIIKENIIFINKLNNKLLNENTTDNAETTVSKAIDIAPELAAFAVEAEEKKEETKSIFKKYGYWILGSLAALIVVCLYAYWRQMNQNTGLNPATNVYDAHDIAKNDAAASAEVSRRGLRLDPNAETKFTGTVGDSLAQSDAREYGKLVTAKSINTARH